MNFYLSGNEFYKGSDIASAVQQYSQGLQQYNSKDELHAKLLLNRAQCYLRSEQYTEASKDCSLLISNARYKTADTALQQLILKAYLRRAQAHEYLGNYSKALADVEHVLSLDPPVSLSKTAVATRSKLRQFVDVDHKVSLSEGRPKMMVTDQQALRLAFIEQPPETFVLGESYLIRLCITNELGLWDRDFIRRSFAHDTANRLQSIADMQCTLSVFDLTEGSAGSEELLKGSGGCVGSGGIVMEMQTCHSTANSSPLSIGEDGKIDLFITLRHAPGTPADFSAIAVMLRFNLDRPLPSSGDVLPVLSLPARVQVCGGSTGGSGGTAGIVSKNTAYEKVIELCRDVHATCVRQIPLSHTSTNTNTTPTIPSTTPSTISTTTTAPAFSAYALESPGYLGIAGKVWDSMYVLLQYLALHQGEYVTGKRIVELGCGTGLAGISLCPMSPQHVTLTDMHEVVPLIHANILLNSVVMGDSDCMSALRERYVARAYAWGGEMGGRGSSGDGSGSTVGTVDNTDTTTANLTNADNTTPNTSTTTNTSINTNTTTTANTTTTNKVPYFDTILASDVVYYPEGYQPLLTTLCDLLGAVDTTSSNSNAISTSTSSSTTTITTTNTVPVCILAHRHRHPEDRNFFEALYAVPSLHTERLDFKVRGGSGGGSGGGSVGGSGGCSGGGSGDEVHALQDVVLFRITKRQ